MQPLETAKLKVFILALSRLEAPLPETVQNQINTINIPADIGKLRAIAESDPLFAASYKQVSDSFNKITRIRSKGLADVPESINNSSNIEIDNSSREIEAELVEFEQKVDNNKLAAIAMQICQAVNPVKMAKDIIKTIRS
jgi:hypothetical protein